MADTPETPRPSRDPAAAAASNNPLSPPAPVLSNAERLRQMQLMLTYRCPHGLHRNDCPFGKFHGVSHASRKALLEKLTYDDLLNLFDLTPSCACPADPRHCNHDPTQPDI